MTLFPLIGFAIETLMRDMRSVPSFPGSWCSGINVGIIPGYRGRDPVDP
ncbi:hypothetical protein ASZ90_015113 [hydrocarbon metagenome]|uniref:Uncharacterized protein n=1 Tax=hydrocarbon metagenome TaxID=938273 RepID=A0A0W8F302_9ZZZZ